MHRVARAESGADAPASSRRDTPKQRPRTTAAHVAPADFDVVRDVLLHDLDQSERLLIVLRHVERMSHDEIAGVLGTTPDRAAERLRDTEQKLDTITRARRHAA